LKYIVSLLYKAYAYNLTYVCMATYVYNYGSGRGGGGDSGRGGAGAGKPPNRNSQYIIRYHKIPTNWFI